jgi:CheY-like chemotaxis protein
MTHSPASSDDVGTIADRPTVIMVVEDEELIRVIIENELADAGFEATLADSGEVAIKMLDEANTDMLALVTDINMGRGRMTGWDVARHARAALPGIPVIYITGDSASEWATQGVAESVLLTKPFAPTQLLATITHLLT